MGRNDPVRLLVQRVREAWVDVEGVPSPKAGSGLVVLVGFREGDGAELLEPMAQKLVNLRIFADAEGRMNRSLLDVEGDLVLVSQFTLYADSRKGRRPSYLAALEPGAAAALYAQFADRCTRYANVITSGRFGADMRVHLINDGPVTILLDSDELRLGSSSSRD